MRCPKCKESLVQTSPDGDEIRLRITGQIVYRGGALEVQCYWCKEPLVLPASLTLTGAPTLRVPQLLLTVPT
jgi:ribosomal protein S27E